MPYLFAFLEQLRLHCTSASFLSNLWYFFRWKRSLMEGMAPLLDERPWITFAAIRYLDKHLSPSSRVFEFGGGGSTLYFLNRCQFVVTAEHHVQWFNTVKGVVRERTQHAWVGHLEPPEPEDLVIHPDAAEPDHYASCDVGHVNFKKYVTTIDQYPDDYFDVVMVDGRSRPACLIHAATKIRTGGLLILDNAERTYYLGPKVQTALKNFSLLLCDRGASPYGWQFTQTNIWEKLPGK